MDNYERMLKTERFDCFKVIELELADMADTSIRLKKQKYFSLDLLYVTDGVWLVFPQLKVSPARNIRNINKIVQALRARHRNICAETFSAWT